MALVLRLIQINQSLWLDEAAQMMMSQQPLHFIWFERTGDFHPPLSYILFHFWVMFGRSEIWLRLLPILFGVVTVFVAYKITQKLFNEKIGLIAGLFLSIAPYHIYYSQEIRMYSMAAFFATMSIWFLITNKRLGYIFSTVALLYTHYMGVFLIIAQLIYKRNYQQVGVVFLLYLPWIPILWLQLQSGVSANNYLPGWGSLLSLSPAKALPLTFVKFSLGRISFDSQILYGAISLIVLLTFALIMFRAIRSGETKLLLYWLLIPIIITFLVSSFISMNQPFRLLFVLPAMSILLAKGAWELGKYRYLGITAVLVVSMLGLFVYWSNPKFQREDWRNATAFVNQQNTDVIFAWPLPFDPYLWYSGENGHGVITRFPAQESDVNQNMVNLKTNVYVFEYLQALSDPNKLTQKWLSEHGYKPIQTSDFNGVGFVDYYQKN